MKDDNSFSSSVSHAIVAEAVSKIYPLYNSPRDRLKEALHLRRKKYHTDFHALSNISFEVKKGERIGIIGQNGSGKSTLLKILSRVLIPTSGRIWVNGSVSSLLELGIGFNQELSGIENVYFYGTILGFTKEQINSKLDEILCFADIGEFAQQPVKTYSSGMLVRLAFSVAVQVNPEILIIDEALSVGDSYFKIKSMNKMLQYVEQGKTFVFVSHDQMAIKTLCNRVLLLDKGNLIMDGTASHVVDYYHNMILNRIHQGEENIIMSKTTLTEAISNSADTQNTLDQGTTLLYSGNVNLISVKIFDKNGRATDTITSEEEMRIEFTIGALNDINDPHFGFAIKNRLGVSAFETNTYCMGIPTRNVTRGDRVSILFAFQCNLQPDHYSITFGVSSEGFGGNSFSKYHFFDHSITILMVEINKSSILYSGYCNLKPTVTITTQSNEQENEPTFD